MDESTFERLVEATDELPPGRGAEAMFILMVGGRLGLRAGEISHMQESWVNWNRDQIEIPGHEPCDCGYCRKQTKQALGYDDEKDFDEEFDRRWKPKTPNSIRAVPFSHDDRIKATIETFFDDRDEYGHSRVSINRRVDEVAEAAGLDPMSIFPHALRACAATQAAYRGVPAPALQSMFGWNDISTSMKYIRLSGGATADALEKAYND